MVNHILIISLIPIFMYTLPTKSHKASADEAIYGLVDLEQLTLERDQGIAAANLRLDSAQFQLREIKSLFYPEFFSRYSYFPGGGNFSAEEVDTRNRLSIRVRQDIIKYFKVKPLRVKESEAEVSAAEAERKESERRTLYELRINYIEALQEKLMADFSLRLKEMYEKLFELQTKRYLSKEVLFPEVQGAERELVEARESYLYHRDNFESRRDLIARHLDIMPDTIQIKEFEPPWYPIIEQKLVDTALQNRAEIKIVEANVLKEEARASAAGFEDINSSVFVGYLLREERGDSGFKSSPEIGAALSFPLNYLSIKKNRSKRFKAMKNFWELEANRVFQGVKMDIRKAHEKYLLENNNMLIAEKGIELKTDELRIEIARLEHPLRTVEASQANVLGIQAEIAILTLENKIAKYEKAKAYYELIYLAGLYRPKELVSYDNAGGVETYRKKYVRALWVWDIEKFLSSKESQTFFISFCKTKGINRVFLSLGESLLSSVSQDSYFPQFIINLHEANIKVSALFGENLWIYPNHRGNLIRKVSYVLDYNFNSPNNARFDGLHLDIEPHVLEEWGSEKEKLSEMYIKTLSLVRELMTDSSTDIELEVDVPSNYSQMDSFLNKVVELVDTLIVMAYHSKSPYSVIDSTKEEINLVNKENKGVIIGLNASDFLDENELEELILKISEKLSNIDFFQGFAIHEFNNYQALTKAVGTRAVSIEHPQ